MNISKFSLFESVRCTLHATLRLPLLFSCSSPSNHNQYLTPPYWQTCNCAPAAVVLPLSLPIINNNTSHHRICRRCAAPCMQLCACRCCSQVPLPRITTNTSHHRICRRCAAPCMQLCACRCCSNSPSPSYDNQYLTPPYLQTVRRPLLATLRLPL